MHTGIHTQHECHTGGMECLTEASLNSFLVSTFSLASDYYITSNRVALNVSSH